MQVLHLFSLKWLNIPNPSNKLALKDLTEAKWVRDIVLCPTGPPRGPHNASTRNSDLLTSDSVHTSKSNHAICECTAETSNYAHLRPNVKRRK